MPIGPPRCAGDAVIARSAPEIQPFDPDQHGGLRPPGQQAASAGQIKVHADSFTRPLQKNEIIVGASVKRIGPPPAEKSRSRPAPPDMLSFSCSKEAYCL